MRKLLLALSAVAIVCLLGVNTSYGQCTATQTEAIIEINAGTSFPEDVAWELSDGVSVVASGACASYSVLGTLITMDTFCFENGVSYTLALLDDFGDGWAGSASYSVTRTGDGCAIVVGSNPNNGIPGDGTFDCIGFDVEASVTFTIDGPIMGCTDPLAINYNPCATVDNGSCVLPTANDECADAITIPVNTDGSCTLTGTGSILGATFSAGEIPFDPACFPFDSTGNDIWFSFTVPASGAVNISLGPLNDVGFLGIDFLAGSCGALSYHPVLGCGLPFGPVLGLTPGEVIYVRAWEQAIFGSSGTTVDLCVSEPVLGCTNPCASNFDPLATIDDGSCILPPTASNDVCTSADVVTAGSYDFYTGGLSFSPESTCGFTDTAGLYYAYTVPAGVDTLQISTCGASDFHVINVTDDCDTTATSLECEIADDLFLCDPDPLGANFGVSMKVPLSGLAGTTLIIRIGPDFASTICGTLVLEEISATCDPTTPPSGLVHLDNTPPGRVTLQWDPVPASVACQVKGTRISPPGGSPSVNIFGPEPSSTEVPYALAGAGTTWIWEVRCACSTSPVIATSFSVADTFMVPALRTGVTEFNIYPNPADQQIVMDIDRIEDKESQVIVTDLMGRVIEVLVLAPGADRMNIDVSAYADGLYIVRVDGLDSRTFEVLHP